MKTLTLLLLLSTQAHARRSHEAVPPVRPTVADDTDEAAGPAPGARYNDVAARRLMGIDAQARVRGDLITVHIVEDTTTALDAATDTSRKNSSKAEIKALLGNAKRIQRANKNMEQLGFDLSSGSDFSGGGSTSRGSTVEATVTVEVIDILPNGNLRIWGYKELTISRETQYVVVDGVVRPRDVQMDNTVSSALMAHLKIEITGSGVVSDRQGPGWGQRILDWMWPF